MSLSRPFRGPWSRVVRAVLPPLAVTLLGACAANPPPGSLPSPPPPEAARPGPVPGESARWTVQLHAGEDAVVAEEVASRARERFDEPVSLVEQAAEYHVEIGEFPNEAEARAFLRIARERGFPDASVREFSARAPSPAASP